MDKVKISKSIPLAFRIGIRDRFDKSEYAFVMFDFAGINCVKTIRNLYPADFFDISYIVRCTSDDIIPIQL